MLRCVNSDYDVVQLLLSSVRTNDRNMIELAIDIKLTDSAKPEHQRIVSTISSMVREQDRIDLAGLKLRLPELSQQIDSIVSGGDAPDKVDLEQAKHDETTSVKQADATEAENLEPAVAQESIQPDPATPARVAEVRPEIEICAAQNYSYGVLSIAVMIDGRPHLVTSQKALISFDELSNHGLKLKTQNTSVFRFSKKGILKYLESDSNVDCAKLFEDIRDHLSRFVVPTHPAHPTLISLFIMGTYVFRVFRYFPYLHCRGEKGSAKTLLMDVMAPLAFNGQVAADATAATLYHDIDANGSTWFLDEIDDLKKTSEKARILKAGFCHSGSVSRQNGSFKSYSVYSPKVLAGTQNLDHVLRDRTITIPMVRPLPSEKIEDYVEDKAMLALEESLRDRLYMFGLDWGPALPEIQQTIRPDMVCRGIRYRDQDLWTPLFAVAALIDLNRRNGKHTTVDGLYQCYLLLRMDRQQTEGLDNEDVKTRAVLKRFIDDFTNPDDERVEFPTEKVFRYFQKQEEFTDQYITKSWLTRRLGTYGIGWMNRKIKGVTTRVYSIDLPKLTDYYRRYYVPGEETITENRNPHEAAK